MCRVLMTLPTAHRDLYQKTGILHRDTSINNLMVDAETLAKVFSSILILLRGSTGRQANRQ